MTKILIIENRMASEVFNKLTKLLDSDHKVGWFIFNRIFYNKKYRSEYTYFASHDSEFGPLDENSELNTLSRSFKYFGININYKYYKKQIIKCLEDFQPDIVIGECTQFYEILLIRECLSRGIIYLNPVPTRYPTNSVEFHLYDTDYPLKHKNQFPSHSEADILKIIEQIGTRKITPTYVQSYKSRKDSFLKLLYSNLSYYSLIFFSSLFVESATTPNFLKKASLYFSTLYNYLRLRKFNLNEESKIRLKPYFLYAMQLQPENNIDIMGVNFSNQSKLIDELAKLLKCYSINLIVKLNPITKYQVNKDLVVASMNNSNVFFVGGHTPIGGLMDSCLAVASVTGTIIIEAVSKKIPVFAFAKTRMAAETGAQILAKISDLAKYLRFQNVDCRFIEKYSLKTFLTNVSTTSYPGFIYNPVGDLHYSNNHINDHLLGSALLDLVENFDFIYFDKHNNIGENVNPNNLE